MTLALAFYYKDIFSDERPDPVQLLKDIPSPYVIRAIAFINDILTIKSDSPDTQRFILEVLTVNIIKEERKRIFLKAMPKISQGHALFAFPYTVALINKDVINYREDISSELDNSSLIELNILKAYLATVDEILEQEIKLLEKPIAEVKKGGDPMKLMWPHLLRQYEFVNKPDLVLESFKGIAVCTYFEKHPRFGSLVKEYFKSLGCSSGQEYLRQLLSLINTHIHRSESLNPADYIFTINTKQPEPVLSSLVVNPKEIQNNLSKQTDYRGLKEKPLFQFEPNRYVVPYWYYLYNALFTGLVLSVFNNSGIKSLYSVTEEDENRDKKIFGRFKSDIGKDFAEEVLFKNTMATCFSKKHDTLRFFEDQHKFNPDAYYRTGNHIFIIEFKDYLLNSEVIQSGSYEKIKEAIDERFVLVEQNGKQKNKGINQLAKNIEWLTKNEIHFHDIDEKAKLGRLKIKNMIIHPIIIQTSVYFDIPGINNYLNDLIQARLSPIKNCFRKIEPFTMIYFGYFFKTLLMFSDSKIKLAGELQYYHQTINKALLKSRRTLDVNDWLNGTVPFSFLHSPAYQKSLEYRRKDVPKAIMDCWSI